MTWTSEQEKEKCISVGEVQIECHRTKLRLSRKTENRTMRLPGGMGRRVVKGVADERT